MTIKEPLTPEEYQSWLARDAEFTDTYADWVSGTGYPYMENSSRTPEQEYARMTLRSYLPGFAKGEESQGPYKENTSRTPYKENSSRSTREYSPLDKRQALMMADRLGIRKTSRKLSIPESTIRGWIKNGTEPKESPEVAGRKRGNRPDRPCTKCGKPTRTHINYKPLCHTCYVKTEEYRKDRSQWASDVLMLKRAVSR